MDNSKTFNAIKPRRRLSGRAKKNISLSALLLFAAFMAAAFWFIGRPMLQYIANPGGFRAWVNAHGVLGRLAFVGMMILQVVVAIIPGEPLEIGAGYAFGVVEGTALCLAGCVIGSVLVFALVRTFGVRLIEAFFPIEKIHRLKFLQNTKKLNLLVFIAFFIPGTPKDLLAYAVGLTPMKLSTWALITATARIPSVITSTIGGDALGSQNYLFAIIVFCATLVISAIGLLVYRKLEKHNS